MTTTALHLPITERSQVADARRQVVNLARRLGLDEEDAGRAAIAVTELSSNMLKHAGGRGELFVRGLPARVGVEILALDRGPGMADLALSLRDGFSTSGTAGEGLGAVVRAGTLFDVWTRAAGGAALVVHIARADAHPAASCLESAAVSVPKPGEQTCGDSWAVDDGALVARLIVADGLGHGESAAEAARLAIDSFRRHPDLDPVSLARQIDADLARSRGATVGVARIEPARRTITFAGIGNISALLLGPAGTQRMVTQNGRAGAGQASPIEVRSEWGSGCMLVMHSDGVSARWRPEVHAGLRLRHPALLAGVLYRDFSRGYDDATVLTAAPRGGRA